MVRPARQYWEQLTQWARRLKRDIVGFWIAARDPRVPWTPRFMAALVAAYALSPIDLIPDFIPVLGYLDDVLIVPVGLWLTIKSVPRQLMDEFRARALAMERPKSRLAALAIVTIWLALAFGAYLYFGLQGAA